MGGVITRKHEFGVCALASIEYVVTTSMMIWYYADHTDVYRY